MRHAALAHFYQRALDWTQAHSPIEDWAHPDPGRLERLNSRAFVDGYCWVIACRAEQIRDAGAQHFHLGGS